MFCNGFWVLWLAEHAPKSTQYECNKFGRLTTKNIREGQKIIMKLLFLTRKQIFRKKKTNSTIERRKRAKMSYI